VIQALLFEVAGPGLDVFFARHDCAEAVVSDNASKLSDVFSGFGAAIDKA
jgi:hypothetical protein